jgi:hypothetical protein
MKTSTPKVKILKPASQANAAAFAAVASPTTPAKGALSAAKSEDSPYLRVHAFRLGDDTISSLDELRGHLSSVFGHRPTATAAVRWAIAQCVADFRNGRPTWTTK